MNRQYISEVGLFRFIIRNLVRQFFKRILGRGLSYQLPTGLRIYLPADSSFGSEIYVTGADIDHGSEALFVKHLDPELDVIDAGANIGYYACMVAPCVRHVWAFEPDPRALRALRQNAEVAKNISVIDHALFSESGAMKLDVSAQTEINSLVIDGTGDSSNVIDVSVETIDSFAARQPDVGFTGIKIDVEGADLDVLKGARETILRHQPLVLTEFNTFEGGLNNEIELLELVKDLEYGIFGFQEAPSDSSGKFSLQRFLGQGEDLVECKMLFLVPPRLVQAFEAEIA